MSKVKPATKKILWVDLEMTGLSSTKDLILEVSAIVTDWDFNELDTYESVIKHDISKLNKCIDDNPTDFWKVAGSEYKQGFLDRNQDGKPLKQVEQDLIDLINRNFESDEKVVLGGNSIYNDRMFIINYCPKFNARLHYRMLDVSSWKIVFDGKYGKKFIKPNTHRALDDVRGSIEELKYYLNFMQK